MTIRKSHLSTLMKLALAAVLLVLLVRMVDLRSILATAAHADPVLILAALALLPANLLLEAALWHRLLGQAVPGVRFGRALASLLVGHSLAIFTPGRAGDVVGRPLYLNAGDRWELGVMVIAHRLMDMTIVATMGTAALLFFVSMVEVPQSRIWTAFLILGTGLTVLMLAGTLLPGATHRAISRVLPSTNVRQRIRFLTLLSSRHTSVLLAAAWLRYLVFTGQFLILILAFAPVAPVPLSYAAVDLVMFVKFIIPPVTFSDIGVREGASIFFFGLLGVNGAAAFNASILMYVINLLLPATFGLAFVTQIRFKRSGERQEGGVEEGDEPAAHGPNDEHRRATNRVVAEP